MDELHISRRLSRHIIDLYSKEPDPRVRDTARAFLGDTFAVMIAGRMEPAAKQIADYAIEFGKCGKSTLVTNPQIKTDAYFAAMANGAAAHVHDYDDVCTTMIGHPSVAVLPAVLAIAEERGCSGDEVLRSYIVGVETCALLGRLTCPEINRRGWHSTETIGVFGAAAAVGCILGLTEDQMCNAIGIAASEAGGLKANYGTMTKPLHAGRAAAKGILSARLALQGFTASEKVFEGSTGFISAFADTAHTENFEAAIERNNSEFIDAGLTMKPWPCCKGMHNAIWAMMELQKNHNWSPAEIDHIDCRVLPFAKDILIYEYAETPLQGKFSINYAIAKVILQNQLRMSDFEGERVTDENLIQMMHKIHMVVDENLIPGGGYYDASECEQVDVYLKSGEKYTNFCAQAKGTPDNPMNTQERHAKMQDCFSVSVEKGMIPLLISELDHIEDQKSISTLFEILNKTKI